MKKKIEAKPENGRWRDKDNPEMMSFKNEVPELKIIAIIPARSGSKGIPDKNVMDIGGRLLIDHSIRQAKAAGLDVIISTDSEEYKRRVDILYPKENLAPFIRPAKFARDDTPANKVILHVLDWLKEHQNHREEPYNTFVYLEPTAPLRLVDDIKKAMGILREDISVPAVVSVCDSHRMHPMLSFRMNRRGYLQPNTDTPGILRQGLEPFYHLTGTIYAARIPFYRQHETFITQETRGIIVQQWQDYEVDSPDDVLVIKAFIGRVVV